MKSPQEKIAKPLNVEQIDKTQLDTMQNSNSQVSSTNGPQSGPKPSGTHPLAMMSAQFKPIVPAKLAELQTNNSPVPEPEIPISTSPIHEKPMTPEDVIKRFMDLGDGEGANESATFAENLNRGLKAPPTIEEDILDWGSGVYEDEENLALPMDIVLVSILRIFY